MKELLLLLVFSLLLALLAVSIRRNPYAYRNVILTSAVILSLSLLCEAYAPRSAAGGSLFLFSDSAAGFLGRFSKGLSIPLCAACCFVCISDIALLSKEGFRLHNFLGIIFSLIYLTASNGIWLLLSRLPTAVSPLLLYLRLLLCYGECTIISICIMGFAVLLKEPEYNKDFAIILGCSISKKGKLRPLLKGRVNRAIRFAWDQERATGKSVRFVPSGGKGDDEPMSEGSAMEMYLISHGAENYEVFAEKESRNTEENLLYSKRIIEGLMKNAETAVVTTNYHALRAGMLAKRAGLKAEAVGSRTKWYFWPNAFLREIAAILLMAYKVHILAAALLGAAAVLNSYNIF